MRVLIVEDEPNTARLLQRLLEQDENVVDVADTVAAARACTTAHRYDVLVLDLHLPDGHGLPLLESLRESGRETAVLVLTGDTDRSTTVHALNTGADDYLTKPIDPEEFKARVRAIVRRAAGHAKGGSTLTSGNVVLDRLRREVAVEGRVVRLTPREFAFLEHFLLRPGEVVTRDELLQNVLEIHFDPKTNIVDVNVARLRKKLVDAGADVTIAGRRGAGFVLSAN